MLGLGGSLISQSVLSDPFNTFSYIGDGLGDKLDTGQTFQAVFQDSFSISFWIKVADGDYTTQQSIWGTANDAQEDIVALHLMSGASGAGELRLYIKANNDPVFYQSDSAVFVDGVNDWKHIVITAEKSGSGVFGMYVNGDEIDATKIASLSTTNWGNFATDKDFAIGAQNNGTYDVAHTPVANGTLMDEWALFSAVLDADAVSAMYNSGVPFDLTEDSGNYDNSSDLEAYYRFEEGTGTSVEDSSGNVADASLVADGTFSSTTP